LSDSQVHILHIIKSLGRGGAETLLPESLRKHNKCIYQFHYLYFLPWKNQLVENLENAGGEVVCFPAKNNLGILLKLRQIGDYVKKHNIQLIHCHLPWAGIVGRLVGLVTKVPVVYTEHNKWERYHKVTYFVNKLSFSNQQRVVAVSAEVANSIKRHYSNPKPFVQVILNGVDTDKFSASHENEYNVRAALKIPANSIVIGVTCVFRAQKRLDVWLDVASNIQAKFPNVHFVIVGDGVLKSMVDEKAKLLAIQNLHFAGLQSNVRPWLKAMDMFMMTSEFEGLPIALLEAMSMKCMPVCTAAGGIGEIIENDKNGFLVPVETPFLLVDKLTAFLLQPEQLPQFKEAARQTVVDRFSLQVMVDELEALYADVLRENNRL
jgi:glycosyltransferase involved in cell wall biosynthesis